MAPTKIAATSAKIAYHIVDGPVEFPYSIDADSAVGRFPNEWSHEPWSPADSAAARQEAGAPEIVPTPEEQAAIDDHAKAVAEANERLRVFREEQAEKKKIADQVAADEALVASPPPRPDPAARRPLTPAQIRKRSAETDEERSAREAREAADANLVKDKAEADRLAGNAQSAANK